MASTFSPNLNLELVGRGDQVGVWDTPENSDWSIVDLTVGAINIIGLNNSPVVLAAAQFQSRNITFNSTLTGSVTITFPTSFKKTYEIRNICTGSSAFIVTLATTAAGGKVVCAPPGQSVDVVNNGTDLYYHNLGGPIGSYLDYGGSSVPNWISGCSIPPYANCDGTAISSLHTILPIILGSSLLPDRRGNLGYALNQGTGRLTTALGGLDGDTNRSLKTTQVTISTSNLPPYTPAGTVQGSQTAFNVGGGATILYRDTGVLSSAGFAFTGTPQGGVSNVLPVGSAMVYGITMIRSA